MVNQCLELVTYHRSGPFVEPKEMVLNCRWGEKQWKEWRVPSQDMSGGEKNTRKNGVLRLRVSIG